MHRCAWTRCPFWNVTSHFYLKKKKKRKPRLQWRLFQMCLKKMGEKRVCVSPCRKKRTKKKGSFWKQKPTTLKMRFSVYCVNVFTFFFLFVFLPNYMVTKRNRRKEKEEGGRHQQNRWLAFLFSLLLAEIQTALLMRDTINFAYDLSFFVWEPFFTARNSKSCLLSA